MFATSNPACPASYRYSTSDNVADLSEGEVQVGILCGSWELGQDAAAGWGAGFILAPSISETPNRVILSC